MKAVIMDGAPWAGTMLTFPVGNELLIQHLLSMLRTHGIREVAVVSCEQDPYVRELVCQAGQARAWKYCGGRRACTVAPPAVSKL